MKYLPILLLFCLACGTSRQRTVVTNWRYVSNPMPPFEIGKTTLAKLDDGTFADYQAISQDSNAYPKLTRIGHGRIYAIGGVMQFDTTRYYFFNRRQ